MHLLTMACGKSFAKNSVFYLSVVYGLFGLIVEVLGFAILVKWVTTADKQDSIDLLWLYYMLAGLVMALTGLFGCYAAIRERKGMLIAYAVFMWTVFVLQLALAWWMSFYTTFCTCFLEAVFEHIIETVARGGNSTDIHHNEPKECHNSPLEVMTGTIAYSFCVSFHEDHYCNSWNRDGLFERWYIPTNIVTISVPLIEVIGGCLALYFALYLANTERRSYAAMPETEDSKIPDAKQALVC